MPTQVWLPSYVASPEQHATPCPLLATCTPQMEEPTPSLVPPSPRAATPFEVNLPEDLYGFANAETTSSTSPHSLESTDSYSAPSYAPTILTTPSEVDSDADEAWMSGFAAGIADTTAYLLKGSCAEREQKLVARVAELNACQHQYQVELMQAMDIQAEVQQWENYLQDLLAQAASLFPDGEEGALQAALHIFNSHEAKVSARGSLCHVTSTTTYNPMAWHLPPQRLAMSRPPSPLSSLILRP
ncbi:hypothetical protein F751_5388 [Auxenochlorella protothecoides]|uniref:Uncharacterized protein n=1 Tax=Auxenochlorella protothecoides TaxID=3075 RepID=A0A087SP78_AUXPR|nr:hypothetical protein F751_5388 [Auxenochlorella protothecoides]KFM27532.1 hypothetical protein F751_5388 [Auxenochlorella protothecoides]